MPFPSFGKKTATAKRGMSTSTGSSSGSSSGSKSGRNSGSSSGSSSSSSGSSSGSSSSYGGRKRRARSAEGNGRYSCPLRVALRRSWSGCHVNMAKIDWPDFHTDGLIVIWRKDEELIALPIRNGRVGFGIHELQGQGASLLQQRGFTEKDTMTLKKMLESKFAGMCLKSRAEKDKEFERFYGERNTGKHNNERTTTTNMGGAPLQYTNMNNNDELSEHISNFIETNLSKNRKSKRMKHSKSHRSKARKQSGTQKGENTVKQRNKQHKKKRKHELKELAASKENSSPVSGSKGGLKVPESKDKKQNISDTYMNVSSLTSGDVNACSTSAIARENQLNQNINSHTAPICVATSSPYQKEDCQQDQPTAPTQAHQFIDSRDRAHPQLVSEDLKTANVFSLNSENYQTKAMERAGTVSSASQDITSLHNLQQACRIRELAEDERSGHSSSTKLIYEQVIKENCSKANRQAYKENVFQQQQKQQQQTHQVMFENSKQQAACDGRVAAPMQLTTDHIKHETLQTNHCQTQHTLSANMLANPQFYPTLNAERTYTGRVTPFTAYLNQCGVPPPAHWNSHRRRHKVHRTPADTTGAKGEQVGFPRGCAARLAVSEYSTTLTNTSHLTQSYCDTTDIERELYHEPFSGSPSNKNNNGNHVSRPSYSRKRNLLVRVPQDGVAYTPHHSEPQTGMQSHVKVSLGNPLANEKSASYDFKNASESRMNFLSGLVHQLPAVNNESQSDYSFDNLDLSDDSVLDDLYSNLPPRQFRKSNMSLMVDRTESDVPRGMLQSDYVYLAPVQQTKPRRKRRVRRRRLRPRRSRTLSRKSLGRFTPKSRSPMKRKKRRRKKRKSKGGLFQVVKQLTSKEKMEKIASGSYHSDSSTESLPDWSVRPTSTRSILKRSTASLPSSMGIGQQALRPDVYQKNSSTLTVRPSTFSTPIFSRIRNKNNHNSPSISDRMVANHHSASNSGRKVANRNSSSNSSSKVANHNKNNNSIDERLQCHASACQHKETEYFYDRLGNVLFEVLPHYTSSPEVRPTRCLKPKKGSWLHFEPGEEIKRNSVMKNKKRSSKPNHSRLPETETSTQSIAHTLGQSMSFIFNEISTAEMKRSILDKAIRSRESDIFKFNIGWTKAAYTHQGHVGELEIDEFLSEEGDPFNVNLYHELADQHSKRRRSLKIPSRKKNKNNSCADCEKADRFWFSNKNNNAPSGTGSGSTSSSLTDTGTTTGTSTGTHSDVGRNSSYKQTGKLLTREKLLQGIIRSPNTRNREGRKARMVFSANIELQAYCKGGVRHLTYQGQILCQMRKKIKEVLRKSGYKLKPGLESFLPLWKNFEKGEPLTLPPVVILDGQNRVQYHFPGGKLPTKKER